jgi:transcriptional regulator with XRE-family HTH domain
MIEQPELGKKILELRKSSGLTQEELVARCNINVRTIQRIEAGEVTPRGHTIRSIFAALDFDIKQLSRNQVNSKVSVKDSKLMIWAFISGLIYLLLSSWESYLDYQLFFLEEAEVSSTNYALIKTGIILFYSFFIFGFYRIGEIWTNDWIKPGVLLLLSGTVLCIAADLYLFFQSDAYVEGILAGQAVLIGSLYLVFSYGLIKYHKEFGNMALVAGITGILTGLAFLSVVLSLPGLLLLTVNEVLVLLILYRAYDKIRIQRLEMV